MIGLALEGGGVRGSYEAGVYMAFYELGIHIDGVCGTSIGALNGAIIASGEGENLPKIWRSLSMAHVFGLTDDFVNLLLNKTINSNLMKLSLVNIIKILSNKGLEIKGIKEVIDKYISEEKLLNSNIDYGLCTVRFKDLKPLYLFKEDMNNHIKEYILASSFLPFFKREKLIDNNYYLDGGFYDLGPVNMLLNKGYKKVYLVKVHGIGITRKYDKNANVIVIESKRNLGELLDLDPKRIEENIKMGYYDAIRVLKNLDGEKYVFKRRSDRYYKFINKNVSKYLYKRVKNFFKAKDIRETTIKALEYIMEGNKFNYYKIYDVARVIRVLKKENEYSLVYKYVKKLKNSCI